jgi:hypothetical protein
MNENQNKSCDFKINELTLILSKNYKRMEYLEKIVENDYDENSYDCEEDYKSDIQQWNTELNGLLYENRNIIHTIGWIVGLKENT